VCFYRELAVSWFRRKRLQFSRRTLHAYLAPTPVYLLQAKVQLLISVFVLLKTVIKSVFACFFPTVFEC